MQLQKADLENFFYAWLIRKLQKLAKIGWLLFRAKPAVRWYYIKGLHVIGLRFCVELFESGVITDPKKRKWIMDREARIRRFIDARVARVRNLPEQH